MANTGGAEGADHGQYRMKNGRIYEAVQVKQHSLFAEENIKQLEKDPAGHQRQEHLEFSRLQLGRSLRVAIEPYRNTHESQGPDLSTQLTHAHFNPTCGTPPAKLSGRG
jgi:hypothetical protein